VSTNYRTIQPGEAGRTVKKIAIFPTLLTLGNAVCGFAALALASKVKLDGTTFDGPSNDYLLYSAFLILAAMVFDALDGYVARLSKTSSEFGGQLDSLCDAISFGVAPAFLLLRLGLEWEGPGAFRRVIAVIAALFMVCAILRLARFNIENSPDPASHKRFKGLPSPAAAGCVASLALMRGELPYSTSGLDDTWVRFFVMFWAPLGGLLVALLMVSNLSYPHFTHELMRRRRNFSVIVQAVLVIFLIALVRELAIFVVFWGYALASPLRFVIRRAMHNEHTPAPDVRRMD
jgi:CDP-diacylglycerol--serine O-phosphatidyltransferase